MYNAIAGSCAEIEANAGGGGAPVASVSPATTSSGNYDNAIKLGLWNDQLNDYSFSNGIKNGSASSFGTASNPTRTTQLISVSAADYFSSWQSGGTSASYIIIGGYIRENNYTSANKHDWKVHSSSAIVSQSFTNGCSLQLFPADDTNRTNQDNTAMNTSGDLGIYANFTYVNGSAYQMVVIAHASGRGQSTLPAQGDSFTIRISVEDHDANNAFTATHDITVAFT